MSIRPMWTSPKLVELAQGIDSQLGLDTADDGGTNDQGS